MGVLWGWWAGRWAWWDFGKWARRGGARRVGGPKFRAFFSLPPFILFFPLWGSFRGILVVFEASGRSNVHVWSYRVVV